MHGMNIKLLVPQEAKSTIQYKNTKLKLLKTNASIWFKKMCRNKQHTPKYINIKVNGRNQQSVHTKAAATRISINQEIKFLYRKKQQSVHIVGFFSNTSDMHAMNIKHRKLCLPLR
jgi:hypothetical protein